MLAKPLTGRTHQIRVHLEATGYPVVGDRDYGKPGPPQADIGLRAIRLAYLDPFRKQRIVIEAPFETFTRQYGFASFTSAEIRKRIDQALSRDASQ